MFISSSKNYANVLSVQRLSPALALLAVAVLAGAETEVVASDIIQPHEDNQATHADTTNIDQSDINNQNQTNASPHSNTNGTTNSEGSGTACKSNNGADSSAVSGTNKKSNLSTKILSNYPKRFIRACPGFVLGTPIAVVRKIISESKQATFDLAGNNRNPFILGGLSVLGIPAGVLSGSTEAPVTAAVNGWKYGEDQLFSKEYFSLGKSDTLPQQ